MVTHKIPRREAPTEVFIYLARRYETTLRGIVVFSIYQISWIKINQERTFCNKRRYLEFVYVSIDSVSEIIFYDFVAFSARKFFSTGL